MGLLRGLHAIKTKSMRYFLLILVVLIVSCNDKMSGKRLKAARPSYDYQVVVIDSCEYIELDLLTSYHVYTLTHKGNCNNPIHYLKQ